MTDEALKEKLILAGRILVAEGQDDFTRGHISVRLPDEPTRFYMKPHSIGFDEITMENILTIDLDGKVVEGHGRRHREVFIHSEIYKENDPNKGVTQPVRAFGMPTEPWLFLIDENGIVRERIEGAFGLGELRRAIGEIQTRTD